MLIKEAQAMLYKTLKKGNDGERRTRHLSEEGQNLNKVSLSVNSLWEEREESGARDQGKGKVRKISKKRLTIRVKVSSGG